MKRSRILTFFVLAMTLPVCVTCIRVRIFYNPENDLTCYTCPSKANNTACNKWAPDVFCPYEHTVCKTVHRLDKETGESVFVEKSCALPSECSLDNVGCTDTGNGQHIECISCCNHAYCNRGVPSNVTSSLLQSGSVILETNSGAMSLIEPHPRTKILLLLLPVLSFFVFK